jgi:hypothetical protein
MVGTARRSIIRVVLSVLFLSLSTEPAAMAGNVTVTDVRELAGVCEAYLQTHTDWFRAAIAQVVEERWPDTSGALLVSEERTYVDDDRATHDTTYGSGRPMFQGPGGIRVYSLIRRLSRSH